jgi:hypothetical protein
MLAPDDWHPIETAWRDGAKMLLFIPDDWRGVVLGWWDRDRARFEAGVPGHPSTVPIAPTHWREPPVGPNG